MKFLGGIVATAALLGCGSTESEELSPAEQAIVNPASPYVGPAIKSLGSFPPLGVHGKIVEGSYTSTLPAAAHSAQFSDGVDLVAPPIVDPASDGFIFDSWAESIGDRSDVFFVQSPALEPSIKAALDDARSRMASLSDDVLDEVADIFEAIPGFTRPVKWDPELTFAAWAPPRARWLESQWAFLPEVLWPPHLISPEAHLQYPIPSALALAPERGARLFCAAREMAFQQSRGSLGEKVLLPISILGQHIDIGVFEPTAYVDSPKKFTTGYDGAQAFTIPFQMGLRISPLRPFLPSLPELRYPLVLTTADSEVVNDTDYGPVYYDRQCFLGGSICLPKIADRYQKRFHTVTHADSTLSVGRAVTTRGTFPLFWAGPLFVKLNLGFGASVGTKVPGLAGAPGEPPPPPPSEFQKVYDDRIAKLQLPPPGWPATIRDQDGEGSYLDGYWMLPQNYNNPDFGTQFWSAFGASGATPVVIPLSPQDAYRSAVLADDDHHVAGMSELALLAGLEGDLGFDVFGAAIEISASGNVTGTLGLAHDLRDGVSAEDSFGFKPISNVTITPTTYGSANLEFLVTFKLDLDLVFTSVHVLYNIIDSTIPVAGFKDRWDGDHRVRLATGSTFGDMTQKPGVTSRVGTTIFPSFIQSVNECLADPIEPPAPPPPCGSVPAGGEPAHVETCISMAADPQFDVCTNIPPLDSVTEPHARCDAAKRAYFCGGVSKQQWFDDGLGGGTKYLLAHHLDLPAGLQNHSPSDELAAMRAAMLECAAADKDSLEIADGDAWFRARFAVGPCDATATLIRATDIVTLSSSTVEPGECTPTSP